MQMAAIVKPRVNIIAAPLCTSGKSGDHHLRSSLRFWRVAALFAWLPVAFLFHTQSFAGASSTHQAPAAYADSTRLGNSPKCPPQFVCLTIEEARSLAHERNELRWLREQVKSMRPRRLSFGITFGPTIPFCWEVGDGEFCAGVTPGVTWRLW